MEAIWQPRGDELGIRLQRFCTTDTQDLMYLHRSMSRQAIEYLDRVEPGWAEDRARLLASRFTAVEAFLRAA